MNEPIPTEAAALAVYLEAVCAPLLNAGEKLQVEHGQGFDTDYTFRVRVPASQMPYMLGRGGENAEAVRRLARARARAIGWHARVDVRIVSA